ncbi:MAG: hypothetical protein HYW45_02865 [Candidatus Daviesbacteria bacterium]|nr:MAG: hypothetical protein HYW45_02865 [Candidatus Daviesbacteria bacterium]
MKRHLAIFSKDVGEKILTGQKTMESRFSQSKNAPFQQISTGDLVYIKPSGKEIIGEFRVNKVIFFDGLTPQDLLDIEKRYGAELAVDQTYWANKAASRYGTLIWVGQTQQFLTSPVKFPKKDQRGWVVLD